jgi:hypothetical protein
VSEPPTRQPSTAEFGTVPVGRRLRSDRLTVAVVVGAVGLGALVWKPWQNGEMASEPGPRVALGAEPSATPAATRSEIDTGPPPWVTFRIPSTEEIRRAVRPRDTWGVRLLIEGRMGIRPPAVPIGLEQQWQPILPPTATPAPFGPSEAVDAVVFHTGGRRAMLIGVSVPVGVPVEDVEVAVRRPLGGRETIPVRESRVTRRGVEYRLLAPIWERVWNPGTYQLRVTVGGQTAGITVVIDADPRDT